MIVLVSIAAIVIVLPSNKIIYGNIEEIGKKHYYVQTGWHVSIFQVADGLQTVSHSVANLSKSETAG